MANQTAADAYSVDNIDGYFPLEDENMGNVRLIAQNDAEAEYFVALFDIPEEYQHLPNINQSRTQAEILVLCRCKDGAHNFPIDKDDKPRYIAVRDKLYKKETVTHQPETVYNRDLLAKQEKDRQRKLVYVTVSGDNLKPDHKDVLLLPSTWNND